MNHHRFKKHYGKEAKMDDRKSMPASPESERAVLGCILKEEKWIEQAMEYLPISDAFYNKDNRHVWESMLELYREKKPITVITVHEKCKDNYRGHDIPDALYISDLTEETPSSALACQYAETVWKRYIQREVAKSAYRMYNLSFDDFEEVATHLENHSKLVEELKMMHPSHKKSISEITDQAVEEIKAGANIVPFGVKVLNDHLVGMTRGEITIIGGRPGHGKTTLMINILRGLIHQGLKVMLFNREMTNTEMIRKLIVLESEPLLYSRVRRIGNEGFVPNGEIELMEKAKENIDIIYKNLHMYDDIRDIDSCLREIIREKPDVVIDDYIQLVETQNMKERRFEVKKILDDYKWLAKKEKFAAILVSQLNREIEKRPDPRPRMSDLAESGNIEQIAETILFLFYGYNFNPDRYNSTEIELITGKARYGTIASIQAGFYGDKCRFYTSPHVASHDETKHKVPG